MSKEELEQQNLGELSEPLFIEHEGRFPQHEGSTQFESGKQIPPDINYQSKVEQTLDNSELGSIPQSTRVTTTYDARPINARDFFIVDKQSIDNSSGP